MNQLKKEGIREVIFRESQYYKIGKPYLDLMNQLDDDTIIPIFSIQTKDFRFEHSNLTGKQIKNKINDFIA